MRIRLGVVAAMIAVLAPSALPAQTPEARVAAALQQATQGGVPVALLETKIALGKAKGVSMDRIAAAVERRLQLLLLVQDRIGDRHELGVDELGLAADAMESGVSQAVLEKIASTAPRDRRAVAIAALTQLVALGHASEEALARVNEALQRGPQALMDLPAQAAAAAARRGPPDGVSGRGPPDATGSQGRGGPPTGVPPASSGGRGNSGRGGGGGEGETD